MKTTEVQDRKESPEDHASFLARWFFLWVTDLIELANRKTLDAGDIWELRKGDDAKSITEKLEKNWSEEQKKPKPSLAIALGKTCWRLFFSGCVLKLFNDACQLSTPLLVQKILSLVQAEGEDSKRVGLYYATTFLVVAVLQSISLHVYFHMLYRITALIRSSMVSLIYKKATRISATARKKGTSTGEIVNLQSNDVEKIRDSALFINVLWDGPLQIIAALIMLVNVIGPLPALSGFGILVMMIPAQLLVMRWLTSVRMRLIKHTDKRVKLITEIIQGIKAIKLCAGEEPFIQRVNEIRKDELQDIWSTLFIDVINSFAWGLGPTLVSLLSFAVYTMLGNTLTAEVAFPALTLFNLIRFPLVAIPWQINSLVQACVSKGRLEEFLALPEIAPVKSSFHSNRGSIAISGADFTWHVTEEASESDDMAAAVPPPPTLSRINLQVNPGSLVIVIGEVGSGKSSLLAAMLGEIRQLSVGGYVSVSGTVAYTAQDPWIQNATVQDNILMGLPLEEEKYQQVIDVCTLVDDLSILRGGDQAEIGEKGINLSGGQKHRVALARAAYADADVYLLDDPLSAVDTHVGRHLFDQCICGLLAQKTRVLVTHQLQYVEAADVIVIMHQGSITNVGTYSELRDMGINFAMFEDHGGGDGGHTQGDTDAPKLSEGLMVSTSEVSLSSLDGMLYFQDSPGEANGAEPLTDEGGTAAVYEGRKSTSVDASADLTGKMVLRGKLNQAAAAEGEEEGIAKNDEVDEIGGNGGAYMDASDDEDDDGGGEREEGIGQGLTAPLLGASKRKEVSGAVHHARQSLRHGKAAAHRVKEVDKEKEKVKGMLVQSEHRSEGKVSRSVYVQYMRAWGPWPWMPLLVLVTYVVAQSVKLANDSWLAIWSDSIKRHMGSSEYYLRVYAITAGVAMVLVTLRWLVLNVCVWYAASNLHMQLLERCMRLPMSFFDTQPSGRLTNRFAKDTEQVDLTLPNTIESYLECLFQAIFALMLVMYVTPAFIPPLVLLLVIYRYVEMYYLNASREIKRLDSLLRSPIFSHFGETIRGLATIRAFRKQEEFVETNYLRVDDSSRAYIASNAVNRWLGLRLELIGAILVSGVAFIAFLGPSTGAGAIGLALTAALSVSNVMNWMVRMSADLETNMNSVERIFEYTHLETEAPPIVPDNRPPPDWPRHGTIQAVDVWVRYRPELDPVLKGLTFTIRGGEKIGVCGRTGCGKSTLTMALYRIVELCQGQFIIDGIDLSKIGLKDLRSKLALVPQDPVIFSGTIRMNLDPFDEARGDSELWEALRKSGLTAVVSALPGKLGAEVAESGHNFSVGQRQLLCMARAVLRNSPILVLDEATSNVDNVTDSVIQITIRESFRHCTVLTIAHRLHTIIDSDRVLLLEKGNLLEFDSPAALLENDNSVFTSFVNKTLPRQAQALRRAALAKAAASHPVNRLQQ